MIGVLFMDNIIFKGHVFSKCNDGLFKTQDNFSIVRDEAVDWMKDSDNSGQTLICKVINVNKLRPLAIRVCDITPFENFSSYVKNLNGSGAIFTSPHIFNTFIEGTFLY